MPSTPAETNLHDPHLDSHQKIDEEIAQLEKQIVSLKLARNALAPVSHLHPDILGEIFLFVHLFSPQMAKTSLLLTWISRHWREIAHNTSDLWIRIDCKHPEWIQSALSRSNGRELEFDIDCSFRADQARWTWTHLIPPTLGNLPRIRKLCISSRPSTSIIPFPSPIPQWTTPAPCLVDLRLSDVHLPPNLFSGTCPSLQILHISASAVDWDTFPECPSLRTLFIRQLQPALTIDKITRTLRRMGQSLEELGISYSLQGSPERHPQVDRIPFTRLRKLHLKGWDPTVLETLLNQFSLPHIVKAEIVVPGRGEVGVAQAFISARNICRWRIDCLKISVSSMSTTLRIIENGDEQGDYHQSISTQLGLDPESSGGILQTGHTETIYLIKAVSLHIVERVLEYFGTFTSVQKLSLKPPFDSYFMTWTKAQVDQLATVHQHDTDTDESVDLTSARNIILFHDLKELEICGDMSKAHFARGDALMLQRWLTCRNKFGLRIRRLFVSGVTIPSIPWLCGLLHGFVDEFELGTVKEDEVEVTDGDSQGRQGAI
ncbi:hypothetical protein BDN72DRAFT_819740 [Pluteus cervinus]|uniref:Uncharacterized protein n=1 Tax=Pluteus cervinus TaxID=181527 RepID=A0ACD3AVD3_9AGAR|nr:hypothetical protein BDN72DRAFT_819740 [Pluteus cervinus]